MADEGDAPRKKAIRTIAGARAMRLAAIALSLALLSFAPLASAAAPCAAEQPDAPAYVVGSSAWRETNGIAGLQRAACEGPDGRAVAADERVGVPLPQDLCVTVPVVLFRICAI